MVPVTMLFKYNWHNPDVRDSSFITRETTLKNKHCIGDHIFVKPARAKCTTRWPMGFVTAVHSATQIKVDGMLRHVTDCRPADGTSGMSTGAVKEEETTEEETVHVVGGDIESLLTRYSGHDRHPPTYLKDYFM